MKEWCSVGEMEKSVSWVEEGSVVSGNVQDLTWTLEFDYGTGLWNWALDLDLDCDNLLQMIFILHQLHMG